MLVIDLPEEHFREKVMGKKWEFKDMVVSKIWNLQSNLS